MGPNFSGMRGLILVLMSNMRYLAVILIFFVGYLVITARYWWLLLVSARYCSFPLLVWTASSCSSYQNLLWQKFDLSRNTSSKNQSNKNQPHKFPIYWICPTPSVLYQIQQQIHTFSFFNDFKLKNEVIID